MVRAAMAAAQQLSHVYPLGSRLDERGVLEIGGCNALELAREFGTPAYVVAEDDLRARARSFREAFAAHSPDTHVSFASKAFPCTAILRILAEEGLGVDVASGGELALALRAGFDPSRVIVHGNAKSHDELRLAVEAGVGLVVLDSLDEVARLEEVVGDRRQSVLLRIAPGVSPDTHPAISTGGPNTKFGLHLGDAGAASTRVSGDDRVALRGLHFHIGSQILDLQPFRNGCRSRIWAPMWKCRPRRATRSSPDTRVLAAPASPRCSPNFVFGPPVEIAGWVSGLTPGAMRSSTDCRRSPTTSSRRATSSSESSTMSPTPASTASRSSSWGFALPCTMTRDGSKPARSASASSPPLATSTPRPSSARIRRIAVHGNALEANETCVSGLCAANASRKDRARARRSSSATTYAGVPNSRASL